VEAAIEQMWENLPVDYIKLAYKSTLR